jgi:hypothetical protein
VKLSSDSRLVRWAYALSDQNPVGMTSVCALFWRCVGTLLFVLWVLAMPLMLGILVYKNPVTSAGILVGAVLVAAVVVVIRMVGRKIAGRVKPSAREPGFLWLTSQRIKAAKDRVCPLIEIEP